MVVSGKVTTQPLPGPSGGVPKMAITVFTKTPAEHLEERRWPTVYGPGKFGPEYWRRAVRRWKDGERSPEWALPDPPFGFIRVKWYSQFERLDCEDGELEANVPLEPNGCLNLTRVENMWGIDRCIPVDPWRMKIFEPISPHLLPPITVECLKDTEGAIRLIEEVSEPVQRLRAVRWRVIRFFRDCEDVPIILGLLLFVFVLSIVWLLLSCSSGFRSWDWTASLDALFSPQPFLAADFECGTSQLAATCMKL